MHIKKLLKEALKETIECYIFLYCEHVFFIPKSHGVFLFSFWGVLYCWLVFFSVCSLWVFFNYPIKMISVEKEEESNCKLQP